MKLGIMQPYFFPYIGYFDLINRTDLWVVFDTAQYRRKAWMNRNRILHPSSGWQYMTIPVRGSARHAIRDVFVADPAEARRRILAQIDHYRINRAPYFEAVREIVDRSFCGPEPLSLCDLNVTGLERVCAYLGIPFAPLRLSQLDLGLPTIEAPGQWALEIASALHASEYINLPGGRHLYTEAAFTARGIRLSFSEMLDYRYACGNYAFVEHLSIVDVMMWNAPQAIKAFLDEQRRP